MTSAELSVAARRRRMLSRLTGPRRRRLPMLGIVWRQHGVALGVMLSLSAVAIAALIVSGIRIRRLMAELPSGLWNHGFWQSYGPRYPDLAMQAIPLIAGLFVGVQLIARELEDGTAQFAWTQGYGKGRWVLSKLTAAGVVLVPMAVVLGLVFGWWYRIYVPVTGYFSHFAFALYAPALAGWTVTGLTLGMAAAALTRHEGRAMWLTVAGWIALHHFAIVGTPDTPPVEFWPLQFAQLAILLAISGLLTVGVIVLIQGDPAIPGMPRVLRSLPRLAGARAQVPGGQLAASRVLAVPRAAWRRHRTGLLIALALLAAYAATLVITGLHIHAEPARLRPRYANLTGPDLSGASSDGNYVLPLLLPFLIGAFLGASLTATDLAQGTVRFAWTQGVTRTRWAAGTLAAVGSVVVGGAVVAGLVFQWWDEPYLAARLADPWFALYPPVYAGWMAVTFTAAAFLGALTRSRTGAAVGCLIGSLVAAVANAELRTIHPYLPAATAINKPAPPGSLLINFNAPGGQGLPNSIWQRALQNFDSTAGWTSIDRALARYHTTSVVIYQPASQFWQLQAIESIGLFALALLFASAAVWVVRRKES